jgi:hypothetical protein
MTVPDETEQLAWVVLHTANRIQAKGSSVRLIVPRAPEMTYELEPPLSEAELLTVEEYLLERGYVAPANIGLRWGTYTITPTGFYFLEGGLPKPKDRLVELAEKPGEEATFESAIQNELEVERHRMAEVERELEEVHPKLPGGAPEETSDEPERTDFRLASSDFQTASERLPWWRRMFGS